MSEQIADYVRRLGAPREVFNPETKQFERNPLAGDQCPVCGCWTLDKRTGRCSECGYREDD